MLKSVRGGTVGAGVWGGMSADALTGSLCLVGRRVVQGSWGSPGSGMVRQSDGDGGGGHAGVVKVR